MELLGLKLVAFLLIFVTGGGAGSGSSASCGASWPQPTSTSRTARQKHPTDPHGGLWLYKSCGKPLQVKEK